MSSYSQQVGDQECGRDGSERAGEPSGSNSQLEIHWVGEQISPSEERFEEAER